ncbi:hypothetical protein [Ferruginibacter sp.]|nr:hypothetical protein [Ferruginibacter sp.]
MKQATIFFIVMYISISAKCQSTLPDSIDINLLNAPSNAAFNLMGISPSSIDKPTDLNAFRLSIQNATNSFTKLPSNYAVEISPAALFNKKSQTLQQFNSNKFNEVFWQSFSVSIGITQSDKEDKETNDSSSFTKLGFGLKASFIRPHWNATTVQKIDSFYYYLALADSEYVKIAKPLFESNTKLTELKLLMTTAPGEKIDSLIGLQKALRQTLIDDLKKSIQTGAFAKASADLKAYTRGLKIERKGPFLDFATGIALDFPDNKFNNSLVSKAGAWLTGGYENGNKGLSILAIGRYLFQPDKIFADDSGKIKAKNISTIDAGARLVFNGFEGKFSLSTEAIYRSVLKKNVIAPSWRLVFNTEYDIGFNQKITLALGRNFDGTISKGGNLIAALNFIKGFGSNKKITKPDTNN